MNGTILSRRNFLKGLGAGALALTIPACRGLSQSRSGKNRPNIVYILADDLGYGDLTCLNSESKIPTPNIDRFAGEGMYFTDAHSPSAVCTPTRYGILTGRYCWRSRLKSGVLNGYSEPLIEDTRLTVPSFLKKHGYTTGCFGKWHLGLGWQLKDSSKKPGADNVDWSKAATHGPHTVGFDYSYIIPASLDMPPYCWLENGVLVEQPTATTPDSKRRWDGGGGFWRGGPVGPTFEFDQVLPTVTEKSVAFIERQRKDKPFFLYVPLNAPHTPWMPTKEFQGKTDVSCYGDFVLQVDWSIGKIIDTLDKKGFKNDTLVIVTSDNGSHWPVQQIDKYNHRANYYFRGQKADIHDGGHRIPFICRWPGRIKPGTHSDQTVCLSDLLATCAGILGEEPGDDAGQDSYNILPAMLDANLKEPIREATVHHSVNGMFAIRQWPWKLVFGRGSGGFTAPRKITPKPGEAEGQLYNLEDDPKEQKNLWLERPEVVEWLTALLEKYKQQGYSRPI